VRDNNFARDIIVGGTSVTTTLPRDGSADVGLYLLDDRHLPGKRRQVLVPSGRATTRWGSGYGSVAAMLQVGRLEREAMGGDQHLGALGAEVHAAQFVGAWRVDGNLLVLSGDDREASNAWSHAALYSGKSASATLVFTEDEIRDTFLNLDERAVATQVLEVARQERHHVNLADAEIIVSGGRGVGGKDGFKTIQKLADALGGEVGGSRVAVEKGWISKDHQVGQTGKTVRPKLYIACGISGSIQHRAGMSNAGFIVAVNKDPNAQIFGVADVGIVADLHEFIPKFVEELKKGK